MRFLGKVKAVESWTLRQRFARLQQSSDDETGRPMGTNRSGPVRIMVATDRMRRGPDSCAAPMVTAMRYEGAPQRVRAAREDITREIASAVVGGERGLRMRRHHHRDLTTAVAWLRWVEDTWTESVLRMAFTIRSKRGSITAMIADRWYS
jgi:hypothetical protein